MTASEGRLYLKTLADVKDKLNNTHGKKIEDLTENDISILTRLIGEEKFRHSERA